MKFHSPSCYIDVLFQKNPFVSLEENGFQFVALSSSRVNDYGNDF